MISSFTQVSLSPARLDDIRRGVGVYKSTWADLRQEYPPSKSCFAPLNFRVSSWSGITTEDVTGLGNDIDADEAYSQAGAMLAYGLDIIRSAVDGPTVDKGLVLQAGDLLATLCATIMDTRDRHRNLVNKAVAEKIGAFGCILDNLGSSPPTGGTFHYLDGTERGQHPVRFREVLGRDVVSQQSSQTTHPNERRVSGPGPSSRWHPYIQGGWHSPDSRWQQPPQRNNHMPGKLLMQQPGHPLPGIRPHTQQPGYPYPGIRSPAQQPSRPPLGIRPPPQHSVPKPAAQGGPPAGKKAKNTPPKKASSCPVRFKPTVSYRVGGQRKGTIINRRDLIRKALLERGLSESAASEYYKGRSEGTELYDKTWNSWVSWCDLQGLDPTKRSEENLAKRLSLSKKAKPANLMIAPTVHSVWQAIDGKTHSTDPDHKTCGASNGQQERSDQIAA